MVDLGKKKFKGVIAHFHATGLMLSIGKHALKIAAKLFSAGLFRIFFKELLKIIDVPPVTFTGTST